MLGGIEHILKGLQVFIYYHVMIHRSPQPLLKGYQIRLRSLPTFRALRMHADLNSAIPECLPLTEFVSHHRLAEFASGVQHAPDVSAVAAQLKVAVDMHPCRHPRGNRQGEEAERSP